MKELQDIVRKFQRSRSRGNESMALATLVRSRGSSYRQPGARMLVTPNGGTVGSLSGGCLEEEIARKAREIIRSGEPCVMMLDTYLRFGCNGAIEVFVERIDDANDFLNRAAVCLSAREEMVGATIFESSADLPRRTFALRAEAIPFVQMRADLEEALHSKKTWIQSYDFGRETASALIQTIMPPIRLVVAGDGPDDAVLANFAASLGWEFLQVEHPAELVTDERTAVILKTHNYGRDFAFLQALLPRRLKYIGILGPKKRRDQLLDELIDRSEIPAHGDLNAVHGPAGLDLGADAPEEIALSIVAEIQAVFTATSGKPLRDLKHPIHQHAEMPEATKFHP